MNELVPKLRCLFLCLAFETSALLFHIIMTNILLLKIVVFRPETTSGFHKQEIVDCNHWILLKTLYVCNNFARNHYDEASQEFKGQRLDVTTCSASGSWCRYSTSDASAPQTAGPCRCRFAHPEAERMQTWFLSGWVCFCFFHLFSIHRFVSLCVCMQAEVKVFSYFRAVWLLAGQFLKNLKCGHSPHVTGYKIGFKWIEWAENVFTISSCFLFFLN